MEKRSRYWVLKVNPKDNNIKEMIDNYLLKEKEHKWNIKSPISKEMKKGDVFFIWASTPEKRVVAKAKCGNINREVKSFKVIYETPYINNNLTLEYLKNDKELRAKEMPSFLKRGAAFTIFSLTKKQGERLDFLFTNNEDSLIEDLLEIENLDIPKTQKDSLGKCRIS